MNRIRIRGKIPGKNSRRLVALDKKYLATGTKGAQIGCKRGWGVWFEDVDGNICLDFANGMVSGIGHCHPRVVAAIKEAAEKFQYFNGPDFYYEVQSQLAKKLAEITPGRFAKKSFLCNSGAEANEAAMKIARWSTGRKTFIAFIGAFHGRTMGALALTGSKAVHRNRFFPMMPGVTHIPYAYCYRCAYKMTYPRCDVWCARILEEVYFKSVLPPDEVAALFVEPIQGEGGYVCPPGEFIRVLRDITKRYGILMVSDEVQAGFGRTGKMFAIENFGVVPEIVTMAKAMGSGLPVGAATFDARLDFKVEGAHSNTYGGSPIAAAATLATIEAIEKEGLLKNSVAMGAYLHAGLKRLQERHKSIGDVRGIGLMQAIELVKDRETKEPAKELRDRVINLAVANGLLLLPCGVSAIRFVPAITVNREEIDIALGVLDRCLAKVR